MIKAESFTIDHIRALEKSTHNDPSLLERSIYAFGLLESLVRVGLPLIFKGGTSLMLLLEHPRRLSVDIDIIVEPEADMAHYLELASVIFPFKRQEEQTRPGHNDIIKRHYKFYYDSPLENEEFYILLDVLFEHNNYSTLIEKQIRNDLLLTEEPYSLVKLPDVNSVLGDKLTAFAPHTVGKLYGERKNIEIIKQFFDIATLIEVHDDYNEVYQSYMDTVKSELGYRGNIYSVEDCLLDTIDAAACIASRGTYKPDEYKMLLNGIRGISSHTYGKNYTGEDAARESGIVMYLAACILKNEPFHRIDDPAKYKKVTIADSKYKMLSYLRTNALTSFSYVVETIRLLGV